MMSEEKIQKRVRSSSQGQSEEMQGRSRFHNRFFLWRRDARSWQFCLQGLRQDSQEQVTDSAPAFEALNEVLNTRSMEDRTSEQKA